jgi:hypothetical protein
MTSLSPDARRIVEAARAVDGPNSADRARIRRALFSRAGIGVAAVAAQTAATAQASAGGAMAGASALGGAASGANVIAGSTALLGVKVVAAVVAMSAVGAGAGYWRYGVSQDRRTSSSATAPVVYERLHAPPQASRPSGVAGAPSMDVAVDIGGPSETAGTGTATAQGDDRPGSAATPPTSLPTSVQAAGPEAAIAAPASREPLTRPSSVAEETSLLRSANDALRSADAALALTWLDRYARRYPRGLLAEEYAATHAVALCAAGRFDEGIAEAETFVKQYPRSPLQGRVRSSCSTGP